MAVDAAVAIAGLSKTFAGVRVLDAADLVIAPGEIHGLIGQNGSGKSTLVKLVSGVYAADAGALISVGEVRLSNPPTPSELRRAGLAFVHQDLGIIGELTVAENVCVGHYAPRRLSRSISWRRERKEVAATLASLHADIDPEALADTLHPGDRAVVAIARACHKLTPGSGCIVFDESTQSLPRDVLPDFYALVRRLAASGTSVLIISHHLHEILDLTDRVSVLRGGKMVAAGLETSGESEASLAKIMLGQAIESVGVTLRGDSRLSVGAGAGVGLSVRGLTTDRLKGLDLEVTAGEVVGVIGASNSGHEDLPYAVAGAIKASGEVAVKGQVFKLPVAGVRPLQEAGLSLVPQARAVEGLALEATAEENLTLPRVDRHSRLFMRSGWQREEFAEATRRLGIVPPRRRMPASKFSGGNQQKLLLAKWMLNRPEVLVLHEPTQAVDIGARLDILRAIRSAASEGVAVLVASIESQELAFLCDRIVVLRGGEVAAELKRDLSPTRVEAAVYTPTSVAV